MDNSSNQQAMEQTRILPKVEIFAGLCFFVFGVIYLILLHSQYMFWSNLAFGSYCFLLWYFWPKGDTQQQQVHGNFFLAGGYLGIMNVVIHLGGQDTPMMYWGLSISLAAAFVLEIFGVLAWMALGLVFYPMTLFLKTGPFSARVIPLDASQSTILTFATYSGLLCFIAYSFFLFQKKLAKTLTELDHQKADLDTLVRIACHDFSGHTTIIRNVSEQIQTMVSSPSIEGKVDINALQELSIKQDRHISSMEAIIGHIKECYNLNQGYEALRKDRVDLLDTVSYCTQLADDRIKAKNIRVVVTNNCTKAPIILFDREALTHQVITNLLTNAIKFSFPEGLIEITISHSKEGIRFSIRDHGIGMSTSHIENALANSAIRIKSQSGTQGERGTGFGLSIMKVYLDKYDATLKFESIASKIPTSNSGTTVDILFKAAN